MASTTEALKVIHSLEIICGWRLFCTTYRLFFFYWQSFLSLPDFSGNESYAWSLSPRDISNNFELAEEVDTFYYPEIQLFWAVWRLKDLKLQKKKLSSSVCVVHKAAKQVILSHVMERKKTAVKWSKMKGSRAKRATLLFFTVKFVIIVLVAVSRKLADI